MTDVTPSVLQPGQTAGQSLDHTLRELEATPQALTVAFEFLGTLGKFRCSMWPGCWDSGSCPSPH